MSVELRLDAAALVLFLCFLALGLRVSSKPLTRLDADAVYFRGQATRLALAFTLSGRALAMTIACIVSIAVFAALRLTILIPLVMAGSQLVSQMAVELCKPRFKRVRPDYWLVGLDAGHSYPSGHATTAVVFYAGWAFIAGLSALPEPAKVAAVVILALWALGIAWSRLALGAHYLSDVAGGALFGGAWLCALFAASSHFYVILR
jgi:undecaprenyl-diphosphatase